MRGAEKLVLLTAVAIPLLVAILGWPMFVNWIAGPAPSPAAARATAPAPTSTAVARGAQPTARPTAGARPTAQPTAASAGAAPDVQPTAPTLGSTAAAAASDPGAAVSTFYSLVSSHQFDSAAQLWSPRMRAAFPPDANLTQRFGQTQGIRLQRADVVSQDQSNATVAVDLVELDGSANERHFVGNWYLVRGPAGWVLDQPQLQPAP